MKKRPVSLSLVVFMLIAVGFNPGLLAGQEAQARAATTVRTTSAQTGSQVHPVTPIAGAADIMFALDISGSLTTDDMNNMKYAVALLVDLLDEGTDGVLDGSITADVRVGLVTFGGVSTLNQGLTSDADEFKRSLDAVRVVGGSGTNQGVGIAGAQEELANSSSRSRRVIILFTDGALQMVAPFSLMTNREAEADARRVAQETRRAGTEIFTIGFGHWEMSILSEWASDPIGEYVYTLNRAEELPEIARRIAMRFARAK